MEDRKMGIEAEVGRVWPYWTFSLFHQGKVGVRVCILEKWGRMGTFEEMVGEMVKLGRECQRRKVKDERGVRVILEERRQARVLATEKARPRWVWVSGGEEESREELLSAANTKMVMRV